MSFDANLIMLVVIGLLAGVACFALLYGLILFIGSGERRVRARVRQFVIEDGQPPEISQTQQRKQLREDFFNQIETRLREVGGEGSRFGGFLGKLHQDIEKANLSITATELLLLQIGAGVGMAVVLTIIAPAVPTYKILFALLGLLLGMAGTRLYVRFLGKRRLDKFEEQLPDTLSILASSVRGGYSLFQALQLIIREAPEPSKTEFQRVIQEISLGGTMENALGGLARRIPTEDVDIMVTAIALQQQTGGNLSHVLDVVATTVRERHRVKRDIAALTAQQRFSAVLLTALPYLLAVVIFLISPLYIARLFEWGWVLCMPIGAVIFSIIGLIAMRRIASIDV